MPLPDPGRTIDVDAETAVPSIQTDEEKTETTRKDEILKLARKRLRTALSAWERYRDEAKRSKNFCIGTWAGKSLQWPEGFQSEREGEARPCFTINRMPGFLSLVVNQALTANLRILVTPVDEHGDVKVAEVLQGLIRNSETISMAHRVYSKGAEKQAEQGLGYLKLETEYADDGGEDLTDAFRQRLKIKRVSDPLKVLVDPAVDEPDFQDAQWSFELVAVDPDVYLEQTGKEKAPNAESAIQFGLEGSEIGDWFPNGKIVFAIYCSREVIGRKRMVKLDDGTILELKNPKEDRQKLREVGAVIIAERIVPQVKMMKRKITAIDVLEEDEWPGKGIPYFPVMGREVEYEGQKTFRGVTYDSIEAAQGYNVATTNFMEAAAQGLKAPVIGFRGQFGAPGTAQNTAWKTAHKKPHAYLEVEPIDINGNPVQALPASAKFGVDIEPTMMMVRQFDNDLKTTAGFHDASLGEKGPQESGKAINARKAQDMLASSDYLDNLRWAMAAMGRQMIQIFRKIYTSAQVIRITGLADKKKSVMVFSGKQNDPRMMPHPETGQMVPDPNFQLPDGVEGVFDIGTGEFDVEVTGGPDPGTQADQELEIIGKFIGKLPEDYMVNFLDLMFRALKSSVGQEMSERAKKLIAEKRPDLVTDEQDKGKGPSPEVQRVMAVAKQREQQMMQALQEMKKQLDTGQIKADQAMKLKLVDKHFGLLELLIKEENADKRLLLQKEIEGSARLLEHQMSAIEANESAEQARITALTAAQPPAPDQTGGPQPQGAQG